MADASQDLDALEQEYELRHLEAAYERAAPAPLPTTAPEAAPPHQPTGRATIPSTLRVTRDPRIAKFGLGPSVDYLTPEQAAEQEAGLGRALQGAATVGGAALGGLLLPEGLPWVIGPLARAAGAAAGNVAGKVATGEKPSAKEAAFAAAGQAIPELGFGGAAKLVGAATRVPEATISETLRRPLPQQLELMSAPEPKAEMRIGRGLLAQVGPRGPISEGRLAMQATMDQATKAGVQVPAATVLDAIESSRIPRPQTPGQIRANAALDNFKADVLANYGEPMPPTDVLTRGPRPGSVTVATGQKGPSSVPLRTTKPARTTITYATGKRTSTLPTGGLSEPGGTETFPRTYETVEPAGETSRQIGVRPQEATRTLEPAPLTPLDTDRILRDARSYVRNAYSSPDPAETAQVFKDVAAKVRGGFHAQMEKAGAGISADAAKAHEYLNAVDTLDSFISDKTPEQFVRALERGESQAQSARDALEQFEKVSGTKGRIAREIDDLAAKREWTTPEKQRAFWLFTFLEKVIARPLTKGLVLGARPAGYVGALAGPRIGKREAPMPIPGAGP